MSDVAEAAVALTAALVAIDSVNPGLVPGAAGEDEIVGYLRARLFFLPQMEPRQEEWDASLGLPMGVPFCPSTLDKIRITTRLLAICEETFLCPALNLTMNELRLRSLQCPPPTKAIFIIADAISPPTFIVSI